MKVAVLGYGTVGVGVYEMLKAAEGLEAGPVLVRPGKENEAFKVSRIEDITGDASVDAVAEVMGGVEPAFTYAMAVIRAGKHFVTSNKALVAAKGVELNRAAREMGVSFLFSAACGGGVPFLHNLARAAETDEILSVGGILNGTTNFMLDRMQSSGMDYADALKQAQELGYAEADPSADIDGWDIQRKLIISAGVAFGVCLAEEDVPVFGIRNVEAEDIRRFKARGRTCKLIASAEKLEDSVAAYVEPTLLTADALEAAVPANFNLISMEGQYIGKESFFGQGAGRYPTAYNVVQDLLDIRGGVKGFYTDKFVDASTNNAGCLHRYYVRTKAELPALEAVVQDDWDGAKITLPVSVAHMHELVKSLLEQDSASFFAAIAE